MHYVRVAICFESSEKGLVFLKNVKNVEFLGQQLQDLGSLEMHFFSRFTIPTTKNLINCIFSGTAGRGSGTSEMQRIKIICN